MAKTVNLSSDGEELLNEAKSTFDIAPADRKIVETSLEQFVEQRKSEANN